MSSQLFSTVVDSPVGALTIVVSDVGLRAILWPDDDPSRVRLGEMIEEPSRPVIVATAGQLREYFDGERTEFDIPLDPVGTALPILVDLHPQFEVDTFGHLLTGKLAGTLQDGSALADDHPLLAVAFDENVDADPRPFPFHDFRRDRIRQFVVGHREQLLTDELCNPTFLGQIGDLVIGEVLRAFRKCAGKMINESANALTRLG